MSTGNLYRYFPSKMDIAEAFVKTLLDDHVTTLRATIADGALPAEVRLRALLQETFRLNYNRFHDRPKAFQLSSELLSERRHIAVEWERIEEGLVAEILVDGVKAGVFEIDDVAAFANAVKSMVFRFTTPAIFLDDEFQALSADLDAVIDVILRAIATRD